MARKFISFSCNVRNDWLCFSRTQINYYQLSTIIWRLLGGSCNFLKLRETFWELKHLLSISISSIFQCLSRLPFVLEYLDFYSLLTSSRHCAPWICFDFRRLRFGFSSAILEFRWSACVFASKEEQLTWLSLIQHCLCVCICRNLELLSDFFAFQKSWTSQFAYWWIHHISYPWFSFPAAYASSGELLRSQWSPCQCRL